MGENMLDSWYKDVDMDYLFSKIVNYPLSEDNLCVLVADINSMILLSFLHEGQRENISIVQSSADSYSLYLDNPFLPEDVVRKFIRPGNSDIADFVKEHMEDFRTFKHNYETEADLDEI